MTCERSPPPMPDRVQANQTLGVGAVLGPRHVGSDLAMSNTDTSELLRLCKIIDTEPKSYRMFQPLADYAKSRLQAEATTDAEVAAIEKRHADCEAFYSNHGPFRPTWQFDRATLLAKLRARTQAEAPTTAAQASVLTEDERHTMAAAGLYAARMTGVIDAPTHINALCDIIYRLTSTVGAPAPAPKHALRCGYWLDLNCSCGFEARQGL
ncbi:hypothetical protein UFOVP868_69 [uncultured Caudovirales phage]|uniref:Uncharacterized protein n=1 Tax=uncultured Caudovirales phage TaxID=2100421 RepID=A0A6J5P7V8_9CAUD|nr:hypothetical protein UFOVP868_69 [uncultured Caudovirales phage]